MIAAGRAQSLFAVARLEAQDEMLADQAYSLFVRIFQVAAKDARDDHTFELSLKDTADPASPEVLIVVRSESFNILGDTVRVRVSRTESVERRFTVVPRRVGTAEIRVSVYQFDRPVVTVGKAVTVFGDVRVPDHVERQKPTLLDIGNVPVAAPADLELRVELDETDVGAPSLHYWLNTKNPPGTYVHQKFGDITLKSALLDEIDERYKELSELARREPTTQEERDYNEHHLCSLGRELWRDFVPDQLKQEYWKFRDSIHTLLIITNESWFPWEMVKPYRDESDLEGDPFWCQQFDLTRWFAGRGGAGAIELPVGTVRPVAPMNSELPGVEQEVQFISTLGSLRIGITPLERLYSRLDVIRAFESDPFSMLHFACHGVFKASKRGESVIVMTDGAMHAEDLRGRFGVGSRPRPLVFMNACYAGRPEERLAGIGGWAKRLVEASVGAFVGAMWEVNDELAYRFTQTFYQALLQSDVDMVTAFKTAREAVRKAKPYNSTWLAYVLYADPKARLVAPTPIQTPP